MNHKTKFLYTIFKAAGIEDVFVRFELKSYKK
jgi:hypothetical protein